MHDDVESAAPAAGAPKGPAGRCRLAGAGAAVGRGAVTRGKAER